jgi:hypothetical protein
MLRAGVACAAALLAAFATVGGCGGGDDGGGGEPVIIIGTWAGSMTHRIVDYNQGTDVTVPYAIKFYILSQEGSRVSGKMELRDPTHVGNLYGTMNGNKFTGHRTGTHTVQIEFTVNGNSLTGTFRFSGDGLDEWGDYTCNKL